jgi:hypothetical protein
LSAVGYELHETASHCECLYSIRRK